MKIGFIGNSSTGKTTCSMSLFLHLKKVGHNVFHYGDTGRDLAFSPELMDKSIEASLNVMFKQFQKETELLVKYPQCTLIAERSVFDWYLYYLRMQSTNDSYKFSFNINEYVKSYDILFYLDDNLPYEQDGIRPKTNKLHNEMKDIYKLFFNTHKEKLVLINDLTIPERIKKVTTYASEALNGC